MVTGEEPAEAGATSTSVEKEKEQKDTQIDNSKGGAPERATNGAPPPASAAPGGTKAKDTKIGEGEEFNPQDTKKELVRTSSDGALRSGGDQKLATKNSAKSNSYVRADLLNLADLDAALEKHMLQRGASANTSAAPKPEAKTERQAWEIDPTKLILKEAIAHGTYGVVHKGTYDGQNVAVKLLDWGEEDTMSRVQIESIRNAFLQEVEVWHRLDHPNVTKFIGASLGSSNLQIPSFQSGNDGLVHVASNICCVVVEYLAGGTLKSYLIKNRRKKLTFKTVIQLVLDLSRGLEYLHAQKIVHRDVKTENMLLDTKKNVKIADFGVARVEASNPKDMTGETGTLGYMAPEVLDGKPYNRKCDVYSFGILLWEVYCCDMPYADLSFTDMSYAVVHQHQRPGIPRCCPASLANVMRKCWDPNPDKRPEMSQVVQMIQAIDTSKGGGMVPLESAPKGCFACFSSRGP